MTERLMSYAEMAEFFGIKPASAKKMAQRKRWVRVVGNDGLSRVRVPLDVTGKEDVTGDRAGDTTVDRPSIEMLVDALKGQVDAERRRADAEAKRADIAEAILKGMEQDRDAWRRKAKQSWWVRLFGGSGE